jgi:hypothetical protein
MRSGARGEEEEEVKVRSQEQGWGEGVEEGERESGSGRSRTSRLPTSRPRVQSNLPPVAGVEGVGGLDRRRERNVASARLPLTNQPVTTRDRKEGVHARMPSRRSTGDEDKDSGPLAAKHACTHARMHT